MKDSRFAIRGLFALALGYTLYFAAELLVPITIALFVNILLSPIVRYFSRLGVPASLSAAGLVLGMVSLAVLAVAVLAGPAEQWLVDAPKSIRDVKGQLLSARGRLEDIQELAEEVDELTSVDAEGGAQAVIVQGPGILEDFLGGLPSIVAAAGIVVFLTYFLLASGDGLLRRLTCCGRTWSERRRIVAIARQIQSDLARYLGTVTIINLLLGVAVAAIMRVLEVPNAMLWGAMVTVFNFAPYVGALASTIVLGIVGLTTFPTLAEGLSVPGAFLLLTILEGQLLTPAILGRRMSLSPIAIFISVVVWGWLWGIAGALMAVPIVTSLKVICDHVPDLRQIGAFFDGNSSGPRLRGDATVSAMANGLRQQL